MSLNCHIGEIVGKRITHVITSENLESPYRQVFLVFDDNTSMELYGSIENAKGLVTQTLDGALFHARLSKGEIKIYPES